MTTKTLLIALGLPEASADTERLAAVRLFRDTTEYIWALTDKLTASLELGTFEAWTGPAPQPQRPRQESDLRPSV